MAFPSPCWWRSARDDECHTNESSTPRACDVAPATLAELKGGSAAARTRQLPVTLVAGGGPAALRDAVALNAGAALYVSGAGAGHRRRDTVRQPARRWPAAPQAAKLDLCK